MVDLLMQSIPAYRYFVTLQYIVVMCLILAETASGCIRFKAYFTSGGVPAPPAVQGLDFSTSAVKADHIGKAKQTFEMVGTALFMLPVTRYIGLAFLCLALPLAYESVRRKITQRVMYVQFLDNETLDHKTLKFWMQVAAMGSELVVGIPGDRGSGKNTDRVLNACAISCVTRVISEAPAKADVMFLEEQKINFVVNNPSHGNNVTDEVIAAKRVLLIGEDCIAKPVEPKAEGKKE
jgi:hypothetical protein